MFNAKREITMHERAGGITNVVIKSLSSVPSVHHRSDYFVSPSVGDVVKDE